MVVLFLGLQSLLRNPLRTVAVVVLVGLSVALFLTMLKANAGIGEEKRTLRSLVATTLNIRPINSPMALAEGEPLPPVALEKAKTVPHVVTVEPYLRIRTREAGLPATEALGLVIPTGMGPRMPLRVSSHGTVITSRVVAGKGEFGPEDMGRNVMIAGKVFAERHNISPETLGTVNWKAKVTLGPDSTLEVNDQFQVIGIYESGFIFGDNQVFLPIDTFQRVFKPPVGFSEVFVTVDSVDNVAQVEKDLKAILRNQGDVLPLAPIATVASDALASVEGNVGIVALVTVVAASVIILLLLILVTRERTREIGILQAVGASNKDVASQFAAESFVQALLGGLVGFGLYLAAGPSLALLIVSPLGAEARTVSGVHGENPIPAILSATSFGASAEFLGIALGIALLMALMGTLYTVFRTIRLRPVEAIRG